MLVMNSGATAPEWGDPPASTVGKQTFYMPADAIRPSNTSGAERGIMETSTNKRIVPYLAFSPSAEEFAQFNVHMPKGWDEGTMTFQISWAHPSTTTNFGVAWGLEITGLGNDDALDTAWGTEVVVTDTGGTTSDVYITSISAPVTPGNSPGAEEWHSFRITRVVGNASDNMAVDAYLLGIKVHYTTNAATDD